MGFNVLNFDHLQPPFGESEEVYDGCHLLINNRANETVSLPSDFVRAFVKAMWISTVNGGGNGLEYVEQNADYQRVMACLDKKEVPLLQDWDA